ncbi:MAG: DNA methyltransferase [Promethearchaeota archaeon]
MPSNKKVDPRNKLNDLNSTEWIKRTKSVWYSVPPPRDKLKVQHPATFAESDIGELIKFFTKKGDTVLDPFVGTGSTLIAAWNLKRIGIGIELIDEWIELAWKRINLSTQAEITQSSIIQRDARVKLIEFRECSISFIITSPPYWKILRKAKDHKSKQERLSKGLATKYSESAEDLGNIEDYDLFLDELNNVFHHCYRVLKKGKYMCVIVSDFRRKKSFYMFHSDIANKILEHGFILKSVNILVQDNKNLYPYGYPFDYVPNINHQFILIFRKPKK